MNKLNEVNFDQRVQAPLVTNRCPVCLSDRVRKLRRRAAGFAVLECEHCALVFADLLERGARGDVGSQESSVTDEGYYENIIRLHGEQEALAKSKVDRLKETYFSRFGFVPKRVLEIGCGTGQLYRAWASGGVEWLGVEANPRMLSFCRSHGKPVIDADTLKCVEPFSHDLIYLSQVLEHVLEPRSFLATLRNHLALNGIVHIDVPNHDSSISRIRRLNAFARDYGFVQPPHHLIAYRKSSLKALLNSQGFEVSLLENFPNSDSVFGQLLVGQRTLHSLIMKCDAALGTGSLLVALAQSRVVFAADGDKPKATR